MCGRYFLDDGVVNGISGEICPGMDAPAMILRGGETVYQTMRWGFPRPDGGMVINARVETICDKPMFRGLADGQRCILPASRYFEWRRSDRQKYAVDLAGQAAFWLAGLYRLNGGGWEFVVLTQPPVGAVKAVHSRMPLLLDSMETAQGWLNGETLLFGDSAGLRVDAEGPEQLRMEF